jgi:hypothetical protein
MNKELQRIAIAKACGWVFPKGNGANGPFVIRPNGDHLWHDDNPVGVERALLWNYIPEYTSDLNAMHEAEVVIIKLGYTAIRTYEDLLQKQIANIIFATAAQRAEAFLRALNLWEP